MLSIVTNVNMDLKTYVFLQKNSWKYIDYLITNMGLTQYNILQKIQFEKDLKSHSTSETSPLAMCRLLMKVLPRKQYLQKSYFWLHRSNQ